MNKEKISIIIPVYNAELYLKRCLNSIINQTYKNLEIIVINDGSTDNTLNIIKNIEKKDSRIKLIDKKNEGVSVARNAGIEASTGKYINFVDADDWLEENAIEVLYNTIIEKNVDVVRCDYYRNYDENEYILKEDESINYKNKKILNSTKEMNDFIEKLYLEKIPCYVWLLLVKKEVIYNKVSFKKDISMMEDTIFYIELLYSCNSIFISDKKLYHYFCNDTSALKSENNIERNINDRIKVNKYLNEILKKNNDHFCNESKIDTVCAKFVLLYLFKISCVKNIELKSIYEKLQSDSCFTNIINNIKLSELSIKDKIQIQLFKYNKFYLLQIYFKFRKILKKLKDCILKRKE